MKQGGREGGGSALLVLAALDQSSPESSLELFLGLGSCCSGCGAGGGLGGRHGCRKSVELELSGACALSISQLPQAAAFEDGSQSGLSGNVLLANKVGSTRRKGYRATNEGVDGRSGGGVAMNDDEDDKSGREH